MSTRNSSTLFSSPETIISVKSQPTRVDDESLVNQTTQPIKPNQNNLINPPIRTFPSQPTHLQAHPTCLVKSVTPFKKNKPIALSYPPIFKEKVYLSADEIALSISKTLSGWQTNSKLWLFAYGSLIWKPEGIVVNKAKAHLAGYHRGLYLWSRVNRGTHTQPGLVLALDRGGSCSGVALQLCTKNITADFIKLWKREMASGAYQPTWLPCILNDGQRINALTFVIRKNIADYAGKLPLSIVNQAIACAEGQCGSTLDYIQRTCEALRQHGIPDNSLERVFKRCCRLIKRNTKRHKNLTIQLK